MKPIGSHCPRKPRSNEEEQIQRAIVQHLMLLALPGIWWCAIPNGEARSKATGGRLKAMGVIAGAPDMIFIVRGKFKALEIKTDKGRSSSAQIAAETAIKAAGGEYRVAKGLDEALSILRDWRVLPEDRAKVARAA